MVRAARPCILYTEDLDAARERAAVTLEELSDRLSEQMNMLSVVAAILLPLGFLTGLLGINIGGFPLSASAWGFVYVVLMLLVGTGL